MLKYNFNLNFYAKKEIIKMAKVDIISGFLGAGKTTLIKKLINEGYKSEKVVLIENEFGEVGIDGGFLKDAGIEITEMNSGCICCSLVGDFGEALKKVVREFTPDRIIIEPSGVGKLSDVIKAVENIHDESLMLGGLVAVVDAKKCRMYMKNFGEFFNNQIENAKTVILSHTGGMTDEKVAEAVELLKEKNADATIITTDWDKLSGEQIISAISTENSLKKELEDLEHHHHHGEHHHGTSHGECHGHHNHHHDEECECGCHHHHHDEECDCHHHDHDEHHDHCCCHEEHHHEHHHEHDERCSCGCHDHEHHHHHHHDADDVFASWGVETTKKFTKEKIESILNKFADGTEYGMILRAKGIVESTDGEWIHFDYVPGEPDVRVGTAEITGRICVIGAELKKEEIEKLFMD